MANPVIPLDIPNPRIQATDKRGLLAPHIIRLLIDIVRRLGGQRADFVQSASARAYETEAMILAILRGITTGYYHTPTNPLSFTSTSTTTATVNIATHTRSTAAATIAAGTVTGLTRGSVYFIYYDDAGDAGGTVTFAGTTSVASLTTAGRKLVGAIYLEPVAPSGGTDS